jgi:hypothetical protein
MRFTTLRLALLTSLGLGIWTAGGCGSSTSSSDEAGAGTGSHGTGSVGAGCDSAFDCRPGLGCTAGKCSLGHSFDPGVACTVSGECRDGLYCGPSHACEAAGKGEAGATCADDGACKSGLRCNLVGFSAQCQAEGSVDAGGACTSASACMGGLACIRGACLQAPDGVPTLGISGWKGVQCAAEPDGPTKAYFHVPRAGDEADFYQLPFPNDIRRKDGRPDLSGHPTPGADLLGYDLVDRYLRAIEQRSDGFGAYPTVFFRFSGEIDIDTFRGEGVVSFIDVTPGDPAFGQGRGLAWNARVDPTHYICSNWLGVRPAQGSPLEPGHTYAVVLTAGGKAKGGAELTRSDELAALLAEAAPQDPALAAAHGAYAPLRSLVAQGLLKAPVMNAAVFTVQQARSPMARVAKAVEQAGAPATSGWVRCGDKPSPCPDASGTRACGGADPAFDELHALVELPVFQRGKAPYLEPADGGDIDASGDAAAVQRSEQVCLSLTVPKGAAPAAGWPLVIYAHGTGGSFRSQVTEGVSAMLAAGDTGAPMAVMGIDQVQHGPRRGGSSLTPNELFFNFANPGAALGNPLQGAADQLSLVRLAAALSLDAAASPTGSAISFDKAALMFWGHSQGATEGGLALPYASGVAGAVLSGQGASLIDSLLNKTSPVDIAAVLPLALLDPAPGKPGAAPELIGGATHPVLSLLQTFIDPADPLNHAALLVDRPLSPASALHVFQPYGQGDTFAPPATEATFAIAAGLGQVSPDASVTQADELGGTAPFPASISGNKAVGDRVLTAAVRQYGPGAGYDGHFVAFKHDTARADVARFLGQLAQGKTPQVGGP